MSAVTVRAAQEKVFPIQSDHLIIFLGPALKGQQFLMLLWDVPSLHLCRLSLSHASTLLLQPVCLGCHPSISCEYLPLGKKSQATGEAAWKAKRCVRGG